MTNADYAAERDNPQTLLAADAGFAREHARAYARPDLDPDRADAYADWYAAVYLPGARTLADLPGHDHAWPRFEAAQAEAGS